MKKGIWITLFICAMGMCLAVGIFIGRNHRDEYHPIPDLAITDSRQTQIIEKEYRVNINTAELSLLMDLPGIGQELAERIIDYRTQNGPFESIDELLKIDGIGEKKLRQLETYIKVGG